MHSPLGHALEPTWVMAVAGGNSVLISALSPLQGLPGAPGKRGKMGRPVKIFRVYYADSMVKLPTQ